MHLIPERMARLRRSLELALNQEWPLLESTKRRLVGRATLTSIPEGVGDLAVPVVATVATDGGENRLNLEPIRLQVLRVADSTGDVFFEDFIAQSLTSDEILRFFFKSNPRLQRFLAYLELQWEDLLPQSDFQLSHLLSMLRELMEWAALLRLASRPPLKVLIRDGLLRSVLLTEKVFARMRDRLEEATKKHGHLLVGVAKRSRVVNYLSVAFSISDTFSGGEPSYIAVPPELEREAAPDQYRWIGSRAMGLLHIARLDHGNSVPLLPVDVAVWQGDRIPEAMGRLHESARGSFPVRGYPQPLFLAHEHAHLGGLEVEVLESMMLEQLSIHDPAAARVARELRLLGKRIAEATRHDEQDEP
ncbi:MAG: DNA double-strand break repair nuclease NurA [Verrucomicrobiales bacterium]|nr:DNA double-strand break repair nuclease NurA [Verrucomicrobiales bacterium]